MKRLSAFLVVIVIVLSVAYTGGGVEAQDGAEATIAAQETEIAELRATSQARGARINQLRTQIANRETDVPVPQGAETPTTAALAEANVDWAEAVPGIDYYAYTAEDGFGSVYALGEVRNTTASAIGAPSLSITLLDADANIVASYGLASIYPNVEPGSTTPYQIWLDSVAPGSWTGEEVEVVLFDTGPFTCTMEVRDVDEVQKSEDRLVVEGNVFNGGATTADGIIIFAALYRTDGVFAGIITDGSDQGAVPPGKKSRFQISGSLPAGYSRTKPPGDYTYRLLIGMSSADARC